MNTVDPSVDLTALYPFLSGEPEPDGEQDGAAALLAEVRASTGEKVREISALRRVLLEAEADRLAACARQLAAAFGSGGRLFAFGNGGSATDAADLAGLFVDPGGTGCGDAEATGPPLPAYVLTADVAAVTALGNDVGFELVFARQIDAFGRPGDLAVGLSTSGNSPNLLAAFETAHRRGLVTVGLSGSSGGRMAELDSVHHLFVVPSTSVHRIQEAQTTIYHVLWELTVAELAGRGATADQDVAGEGGAG